MNNATADNGFIVAGVNLVFSYAAGEAASRFLIALRDEQKIYGTRCPACRRILAPARSFCPRCFVETNEWLEVGPAGTLVAFAPSPQPSPAGRGSVDAPLPAGEGPGLALSEVEGVGVGFGLIRLDGADTRLLHRLGQAEPDVWRSGMRVAAVFAETRSGSILDIAYFKPA